MHSPDTFSDQNLSRRQFLQSIGATAATTSFQTSNLLAAKHNDSLEKLQQTGVSFSGDEQYISIPHLRYTGDYPLTIEALVTPKEAKGEMTIIGNHHSNGLALRMKGGFWEFVIHDGKRYVTAQSDALIEEGKQVHVAGVCDGRFVGLFVDGEPQKSFGRWEGIHKASRYDFLVGADPDGTGKKPQHEYTGNIHALRMSATAKDFRKVQLFNPVDRQDVLYYTFEEGEGETVRDHTRFRHDGKIHGAGWVKQ